MIFGSRAEKFIGANTNEVQQPDLFPDDRIGQLDLVKATLVKQYQKHQTKLNLNHPGRSPLPETLRREVTELLPTEDVSGLNPVGKEVTEMLEYQPGELFVKQIIRPEYLKPTEDGLNARRLIAPLPALPLPKAIAGSSLLTHLLVSKYVDHLPVYRQLEMFKRQKVEMHYSTVSGWIKESMELVKPVYDLNCRQVLNSDYLNADETTIKVLDKIKKTNHAPGLLLGLL